MFRCTCVVDEWDGISDVPLGALVLTNVQLHSHAADSDNDAAITPDPANFRMSTPTITKRQAIAAYGGKGSALANALGITPSAVYQWPDGPIDERWALKLAFVLRPDIFGPPQDSTAPAVQDATPHPAQEAV